MIGLSRKRILPAEISKTSEVAISRAEYQSVLNGERREMSVRYEAISFSRVIVIRIREMHNLFDVVMQIILDSTRFFDNQIVRAT